MSANPTAGEIPVETAGSVRRAVAFCLDALVLLTVVAGAAIGMRPGGVAEAAEGPQNPIDRVVDVIVQRPAELLEVGLLLLAAMLVLPVASRLVIGRSPGARVMGIGPVDRRGQRPGYGRTLLRAVARVAGGVLLGFGWLWALMDPERRTLHDRLTGVWVIRSRGSDTPTEPARSDQLDL